MRVALSKAFGPLKDYPARTTPREEETDEETGEEAVAVVDMHHISDTIRETKGHLVNVDGAVVARNSPVLTYDLFGNL